MIMQVLLMNSGELIDSDDALNYTLQAALQLVEDYLAEFAQSPSFREQIQLVFGDNIDEDAINVLRQQWLLSQFTIPPIQILNQGQLNGAFGAFAKSTNRIYLSQEFVEQNSHNLEVIADLLIEELGHAIDFQFHPHSETQGDEGELLSALVRGVELTEEEILRIQYLLNKSGCARRDSLG